MGREDIFRKIIQVASDVVEVLCFTGKDLLYMKLWNSSGQGNVKETPLALGTGLKIMLLRDNDLCIMKEMVGGNSLPESVPFLHPPCVIIVH